MTTFERKAVEIAERLAAVLPPSTGMRPASRLDRALAMFEQLLVVQLKASEDVRCQHPLDSIVIGGTMGLVEYRCRDCDAEITAEEYVTRQGGA